MRLNYQSQHTNISLKDIVESLKCMQGVNENLHKREDETENFNRRVPSYYWANGVQKSGGVAS